jgi:hypothetical protein
VWVLDPANSPDLIAELRPHSASDDFEVIWCGEGWRQLVTVCHRAIRAVSPEYRFYAIKQKWGLLAYQVATETLTAEERAHVDQIIDEAVAGSERTCEWCGGAGSLRDDRRIWLTLCDSCDRSISDPPGPPYPSDWPPEG